VGRTVLLSFRDELADTLFALGALDTSDVRHLVVDELRRDVADSERPTRVHVALDLDREPLEVDSET
jgi:hypothetical protein